MGMRFTHVYVERGEPMPDSVRMRKRLGVLFAKLEIEKIIDAAGAIEGELGVSVPRRGGYHYVEVFFEQAALHDMLDSVTILSQACRRRSPPALADAWRDGVARILREENIGYQLDSRAGVHFLVDEDFERTRQFAIAALQKGRYSAVTKEFDAAYRALDAVPPDTKTAVRAVFESLEILFKLMCTGASRLGSSEINSHLRPLVDRLHSTDAVAQRAAAKMVSSLADWVEGVHFYRHGQAVEEPAPPPLSLTLLTISTGAGFLRWLAELDGLQNGST